MWSVISWLRPTASLPTSSRRSLSRENRESSGPAGTLVVYTEDGERWSEPRPAYDPPWSLWKPKTHAGIHYVAADIMEGNPRLDLLESHDGLRWNKVSTILEGEYTETALLFLPDDSLLAFTRQGPGPSISHARPPYSRWKVYEGPKMGRPRRSPGRQHDPGNGT